MGKIRKAVEVSIKYALAQGKADKKRDAAVIEVLRYMADQLDDDTGQGTPKARYITPASFLSYCQQIGIVPDPESLDKSDRPRPAFVVGQSKWKVQNGNGIVHNSKRKIN